MIKELISLLCIATTIVAMEEELNRTPEINHKRTKTTLKIDHRKKKAIDQSIVLAKANIIERSRAYANLNEYLNEQEYYENTSKLDNE